MLAYDPRENSRSPLDGPPQDQRIEEHCDDAHRLLSLVAQGAVAVFGSSSGTLVGLDLVARYPDQVHRLIAHEPPAFELLPEAARHRAFLDDVYDLYRRSGVLPAMQHFAAGVGMADSPRPPPGVELPAQVVDMMTRMLANSDFFLAHELRQFTRYVPDVAALAAAATRIALAVGADSRAHLPARPARVLAGQLGSEVVDFPGGHAGYATHPADFAARLADVLDGAC